MLGNQSDISLKVIEADVADVHDLHATIRSPSGHEEPCLLKQLSNGSLSKWMPPENPLIFNIKVLLVITTYFFF